MASYLATGCENKNVFFIVTRLATITLQGGGVGVLKLITTSGGHCKCGNQ